MKLKKYLYSLFLAFLVVACATPVPPTGGVKDTTPPVPLHYNPKNNALGLKSKTKVKISFDEYIVLAKLNEQLIMSPPVKKMPEVNIVGKKLEIVLPDSLDSNTTYNIFFGDAVQNYKENLPIQNFSYSFSTGDFVDSLQVQGKVLNAFDLKPVEGVLVILYRDTCDTVGLYQKPYYIAKSKADGTYKLQNLSAGKYKMFGIKDLNNNYIYDQPDEEIAFKTEFVESVSQINYPDSVPDSLRIKPAQINLHLYKEEFKKQAIIGNGAFTTSKIQIITRNPLQKPDFKFLNSSNGEYFLKQNQSCDTNILWLKGIEIDTLLLEVSDNESVVDTSRFYLSKVRKANDSSLIKNFMPLVLMQGQQAFFSPVLLEFPFPVKSGNFGAIKIVKTSGKEEEELKIKCSWLDSFPYTKLRIDARFEEREVYRILIPMGEIVSIYGNVNDTLKTSFSTTQSRNYGSLKLQLSGTNNRNLIIQLLNSADKVIEEHRIQGDTSIRFPYLSGANYKVKAIEDANNNGVWDKGKYSHGILPERVFYLKDLINVRTNWDINWKWMLE